MITHGLLEFISRDWGAARDAKDAYWGERVERLGPLEGLRIAEELRRQALLQDPAWPHPADRHQDLLSHEGFLRLLHGAGDNVIPSVDSRLGSLCPVPIARHSAHQGAAARRPP